jgi:citrate lyase subunit beta/citryl-CoA lyase
MRRLRSLLNTPANRPTMLDKAPGYGADALILDLEDSVPLAEKAEARVIARDYLARFAGQGIVTYVRVNALDSGLLEDDLDAIVGPGLEGIQTPKVGAAGTVLELDRRLAALEAARGLEVGAIELFVSLESAAGVFHAHDILSATPRVGSVLIGTAEHGDLQGDMGYVATASEHETAYLRAHVLLAARVAGIDNPIDGVYTDFRNLEGLEATSRRARELGYRGKKAIHPGQIEVINRVFSPTAAELDHYERVLVAFEQQLARGEATGVVDGKMIDYAMVETARRMLAREVPR